MTAALAWAEQSVPVLPLYSVADGICDCREGSECRSPGKHPLSHLVPHGVKDATTNPETIRRWWASVPLANVGIATGGQLRLLAVDVDPRAGGDASLCDLVEAHGCEWLDTFSVKTGGLGNHFIFTLPTGTEVHRGKLSPGIDVKGEGGYLVAAPSLHASGRNYVIEKNTYAAAAPAWLVEELTRAHDIAPATVVAFQENSSYRERGGLIAEGERNDRLFRISCALWGGGDAPDLPSLHARILEVNAERCIPPLAASEVAKIASSVAARFPRGAITKARAAGRGA